MIALYHAHGYVLSSTRSKVTSEHHVLNTPSQMSVSSRFSMRGWTTPAQDRRRLRSLDAANLKIRPYSLQMLSQMSCHFHDVK